LEAEKQSILFSIGVALVGSTANPAALAFLEEYKCPQVEVGEVPRGERDLLGVAYQFLNSKLENLSQGSFYTGPTVADDLVAGLRFDNGEKIFDPACGSGALLFASNAPAEQIVGVDFDPVAVMIAKFNYFLKYPEANTPAIYCADFFKWRVENKAVKFDYVVGNPPYGANLDTTYLFGSAVTSGESFSHFIETGFDLVTADGELRYLVPEALLNVKRHTDIRDLILGTMDIRMVKNYSSSFSGVMSDIYRIDIGATKTETITWVDGDVSTVMPKALFYEMKDHIFVHLTELDLAIIDKVKAKSAASLHGSIFGLGIVTGDNKSKLFSEQRAGTEPIFTGKEMAPYRMEPARNYVLFDRNQLQQVAPDHIYRAPEKLVYKTITTKLMVAIDKTGALTSNSANLIIPDVPGNTVETLAALLNSALYSFLNIKLFGGVNKIARANLEALPLPVFAEPDMTALMGLVVAGRYDEAQDWTHSYFGLTKEEIAYIGIVVAPPRCGPGKAKTRKADDFGKVA
jgi:hypothetical protein